jgi:hypothetical protein
MGSVNLRPPSDRLSVTRIRSTLIVTPRGALLVSVTIVASPASMPTVEAEERDNPQEAIKGETANSRSIWGAALPP